MAEYGNLTLDYVIKYIKNIANEDDVVVNLSSYDAVYNFLRFKHFKNSENLQTDLVKFVNDECGKFLYISTKNEMDYFKHIIEKRGYSQEVSDEETGKVEKRIDKVQLSKQIHNISDPAKQMSEYKKFEKFFKKVKDYYYYKNEHIRAKYENLETFYEKELGYKLKAVKKFGYDLDTFKKVIASFADENNCVDSLKHSGNHYKSITRALSKCYTSENLVEELPIVEQFVMNEMDGYYFSVIYQQLDVVKSCFNKLNEMYPNGIVLDLKKNNIQLYQSLVKIRNVIAPYTTLKSFIENGSEFEFRYPHGKTTYGGKVLADNDLRKILTTESKNDNISSKIKKHMNNIRLNAAKNNMSINDYVNNQLNLEYAGKNNNVEKRLKRVKVSNPIITNGEKVL